MIPLFLGTALALTALAFVLFPLFAGDSASADALTGGEDFPLAASISEEASAGDRALGALREIEFDRETGKLAEADYSELKEAYTREALAAMRAQVAASANGITVAALEDSSGLAHDAVMYSTSAASAECDSCGPRPEADARYCSDCGRFLSGGGATAQSPQAS